jgi:hypothetical protein
MRRCPAILNKLAKICPACGSPVSAACLASLRGAFRCRQCGSVLCCSYRRWIWCLPGIALASAAGSAHVCDYLVPPLRGATELLVHVVIAACIGGLLGVLTGWLLIQIRVRYRRGEQCTRCGYDLTGNLSGRCPECGERI